MSQPEMSAPETENNALPPDIPPEAVSFLHEVGYLQPDRLKVGDAAPRLTLNRLNADAASEACVEIGSPHAVLPMVLIFGSYT